MDSSAAEGETPKDIDTTTSERVSACSCNALFESKIKAPLRENGRNRRDDYSRMLMIFPP